MNSVKIELNLKGINELMKSDAVRGALHEAGKAVASAAGDGFETETHTAQFTAIENVYPDDPEAYYTNLKHNTLLKAAGQAGLFLVKPRL